MKIKKYLLNIVSIILLLLIMVALIIALTKITDETRLNANVNDGSTNIKPPSFEYIDAKKSNLAQINFENNFGGTGTDTVLEVFSLNNNIVIGKTTSNNYYFENKTGSLFVAVIDFSGNCKKIICANEPDTFEYVNSIMFNNNIYILINNSGYKVYEFNIIKQTLTSVCNGSDIGIKIVANTTPFLICSNELKSYALNLTSKKKIEFDSLISNIVSISPFGDDLLVIYNSGSSFKIASLSANSISTIKDFKNCNVLECNINKTNYIFLIKTSTQTEFLILDKSFNVSGDVVTKQNEKSNIYNFGTYNTMLYLNNNTLNSLEFCSHGDELLLTPVCNNVLNYYSICINDEIFVFVSLNSQLNIYKISNHNNVELIDILQNVNGLEVTSVFYINSRLSVIGNVNQINSVITNCYGGYDIFIFEFAL